MTSPAAPPTAPLPHLVGVGGFKQVLHVPHACGDIRAARHRITIYQTPCGPCRGFVPCAPTVCPHHVALAGGVPITERPGTACIPVLTWNVDLLSRN